MVVNVTIEIGGIKNLEQSLKNIVKGIKKGIKEGSQELITGGEKVAKDLVKPFFATGVLFNNIYTDIRTRTKVIYESYLISAAPHSIFIEKGYKRHLVPVRYIEEWLSLPKVSPAVKDFATKAGFLWVGPFKGVGFMNSAYMFMVSNAGKTYAENIFEQLRVRAILGGIK